MKTSDDTGPVLKPYRSPVYTHLESVVLPTITLKKLHNVSEALDVDPVDAIDLLVSVEWARILRAGGSR